MTEIRKLAGLSPRYTHTLKNTKPSRRLAEDAAPAVHPSSPEDDQDLIATPPPDDQEPEATGAGPSTHWDMFRDLQEQGMQLYQQCQEMYDKLSQVNEADGEMDRDQRRTLKGAQLAVREAMRAQKEAYRKIAEFGGTMLGR